MNRRIVLSLGTLSILAVCLSLQTANAAGRGKPKRAASGKERMNEQAQWSGNAAVQANNSFGLALYRRMAAESSDSNLFLSPYSVSAALAMTAEGARGETYSEMARTLDYPEAGGDPNARMTEIHAGFAAMRRRFIAAAGAGNDDIRKRINALKKKLEDSNREARELERSRDWQAANRAARKSGELAGELNDLLSQVDRFELSSANALWVDQRFPLLANYTDRIDQFYESGGATPLDFRGATESSRRRINGWVEEHTSNRIRDLIPRGKLSPDTGLVITNAIYFLGQWATPFDRGDTRDEEFLKADGVTRTVDMMRDSSRADTTYAAFNGDGSFFDTPRKIPAEVGSRPPTYPDDAGFTMIELPYKGDELVMTILAPRTADGLAAIESKLDAETLNGWLAKLVRRETHVRIPRFNVESSLDMGVALQSMGMKRAFVSPPLQGCADFSGMSQSRIPREQLFIGAVLHKAWVQVNEEGTEAAAATAVLMAVGAAAPRVDMLPFTPEFRADRPFLFLIRDRVSGVILFVGRINDPAA
ncbi:MAG TPA: serpin family protein [Phycisphaerae bacterium]|nr:serpin family protein [Phycisphaerae bacterium]HRW53534.1 serpin family protein [Phycisphaerae bacterium]